MTMPSSVKGMTRKRANSSCQSDHAICLKPYSQSLHRGNFSETFGEDFFGLKALGIADEFGLSSLTVPKRLLRKKAGSKEGPVP